MGHLNSIHKENIMSFFKKVIKAIKEREKKEKAKSEASKSLAELTTKSGTQLVVLPKAISSMDFFTKHMLVAPTEGLYHDDGKLVAKAVVPENKESFYVDVTDEGELVVPPNAPVSSTVIIGSGVPALITKDLESACIINRYTQIACAVPLNDDGIKLILKAFPASRLISDSLRDDSFVDGRTININTYDRTEVDATKFAGKHFSSIQEYYEAGGDVITHLNLKVSFVFEPFWRIQKRYKKQRWIIQDLIPAGPSLTLLFSPSGVGKTFLIIALSLSVATGLGQWNGRTCQTGQILYFCGEGKASLVPRITAWCQEYGIDDPRTVNFYAEDGLFDVADPQTYEELLNAIEVYFADNPPLVMIFDTMNLFMGEGDENSTRDANRFIHRVKEMTLRMNCAIILVHHTGVTNEERARGSSVFKGALDSELRLERSKSADLLTLTQTKSRYGKEIDPVNLILKEVSIKNLSTDQSDEDEEEISCVLVPADDDDNIFEGALGQDIDFIVRACSHFNTTSITKEQMITFAKSNKYDGPVAKNPTVKLNKKQKGKTLWRLLEYSILEETETDTYKIIDPIVISKINAVTDTAKE